MDKPEPSTQASDQTQKAVSPRSTTQILSFHRYRGGFWFRIFGFGLSVANRELLPALFSERNGLVGVVRIGKWALRLLT